MLELRMGLYVTLVVVLIVLFVVSLFIPFYGFMLKRFKGLALGCLLQPVLFAAVAVILVLGVFFSLEHEISKNREDAMVILRAADGDGSDAFITRWYLKPDGICFCEYGQESEDGSISIKNNNDRCLYDVVPLDSCSASVDDVIVVRFDFKNRKATAVNYDEPLEVIHVDWDRVEQWREDQPPSPGPAGACS